MTMSVLAQLKQILYAGNPSGLLASLGLLSAAYIGVSKTAYTTEQMQLIYSPYNTLMILAFVFFSWHMLGLLTEVDTNQICKQHNVHVIN